MKTKTLALIFTVLSSLAMADDQALNVTLHGAGHFFDRTGFKVVRLVIGDLIAEGQIRKYTDRIPDAATQGARSFCVESTGDVEAVQAALKAVAPRGRYLVEPTAKCE